MLLYSFRGCSKSAEANEPLSHIRCLPTSPLELASPFGNALDSERSSNFADSTPLARGRDAVPAFVWRARTGRPTTSPASAAADMASIAELQMDWLRPDLKSPDHTRPSCNTAPDLHMLLASLQSWCRECRRTG